MSKQFELEIYIDNELVWEKQAIKQCLAFTSVSNDSSIKIAHSMGHEIWWSRDRSTWEKLGDWGEYELSFYGIGDTIYLRGILHEQTTMSNTFFIIFSRIYSATITSKG